MTKKKMTKILNYKSFNESIGYHTPDETNNLLMELNDIAKEDNIEFEDTSYSNDETDSVEYHMDGNIYVGIMFPNMNNEDNSFSMFYVYTSEDKADFDDNTRLFDNIKDAYKCAKDLAKKFGSNYIR
jgi:hypothetical protein